MKKILMIPVMFLLATTLCAADCTLEGQLVNASEVMLDVKPAEEYRTVLGAYAATHPYNPVEHTLGLVANIAFLDLVKDMQVGDELMQFCTAVSACDDPADPAAQQHIISVGVVFTAQKGCTRNFQLVTAKETPSETGMALALSNADVIVYGDGSIYVVWGGCCEEITGEHGHQEPPVFMSAGEAVATWDENGSVDFINFLEGDDYSFMDEIRLTTYLELQSYGMQTLIELLGYNKLCTAGSGMGLQKVD